MFQMVSQVYLTWGSSMTPLWNLPRNQADSEYTAQAWLDKKLEKKDMKIPFIK